MISILVKVEKKIILDFNFLFSVVVFFIFREILINILICFKKISEGIVRTCMTNTMKSAP